VAAQSASCERQRKPSRYADTINVCGRPAMLQSPPKSIWLTPIAAVRRELTSRFNIASRLTVA